MPSLNYKNLITALASLAIFNGCAMTQTPILDEHFGEAVNAAVAKQTMNPEASLNRDAALGLGGKASKATVDRYHRTFESPPTNTNVFNIGVGTGGSSSGTPVK